MLRRKVELLHRSSRRMMQAQTLVPGKFFWPFMWREIRIHLRRTLEVVWMVIRRKNGPNPAKTLSERLVEDIDIDLRNGGTL